MALQRPFKTGHATYTVITTRFDISSLSERTQDALTHPPADLAHEPKALQRLHAFATFLADTTKLTTTIDAFTPALAEIQASRGPIPDKSDIRRLIWIARLDLQHLHTSLRNVYWEDCGEVPGVQVPAHPGWFFAKRDVKMYIEAIRGDIERVEREMEFLKGVLLNV